MQRFILGGIFLFIFLIHTEAEQMLYKDASMPISERVEDLLSRMTLKEKAMQLTQGRIGENDNPNNIETGKQKFIPTTGSFIFFATNVTFRNSYQKRAIENTRLGIPLLFAYDVIHGYRTIYPISLGQACSFNTNLVEKACRFAAKEASDTGINWTFSPMIDVARDPRWGRVSEGYGEDPLVNSAFCVASVKGYQGDDLSQPDTLASCLKHFVGYSESVAGIDYAYSDISERAMWEIYLPPYLAGINAGAATIMSGFNDINGIPAVCNELYLNDILRDKWGFEGLVVSDWGAIKQLKNQGFSKNPLIQGSVSLKAGNDMDMMSGINMRIPKMVEQGFIDEEDVNKAVRRVLALKFKLGLFENPYTGVKEPESCYLKEDYLNIAEQLSIESMVLLKNNQILPITTPTKVAVVGNLLDDNEALLGSWAQRGRSEDVVDIMSGLEWYKPTDVTLIENVEDADVILLCIGETQKMSGENGSRSTIKLHNEDLVDYYKSFGKKIILITSSGRPISFQNIEKDVEAILHIWQPGTTTGTALAKIIFGINNPSGKLAMTFPRTVGQIPIYYNKHQSARIGNKDWSGLYQDIESTPMYEFGYGLSYTTFSYSDLIVDPETLQAQVTVTNSGKYPGKETVLWFISDPEASFTQPIKKLKHFQKIDLLPNESETVIFPISKTQHLSYNKYGESIFEAGLFRVEVGSLESNFEVSK
ncbi:MAG: glycoside hydrolase family 3 N-terminal domain-containing protein [Pontiellaceae bacterium]